MSHNCTPVSGASIVHSTTEADLAAFDELDPRLRRKVNELPFRQSAQQVLEFQRAYGPEVTMVALDQRLAALFPDWKPV